MARVQYGALIRLCPGKRHAWFDSSVGLIRKPVHKKVQTLITPLENPMPVAIYNALPPVVMAPGAPYRPSLWARFVAWLRSLRA